jgi:hypothetical protein
LLVRTLAELAETHPALRVDEIQRWPVFIVECPPYRVIAVDVVCIAFDPVDRPSCGLSVGLARADASRGEVLIRRGSGAAAAASRCDGEVKVTGSRASEPLWAGSASSRGGRF